MLDGKQIESIIWPYNPKDGVFISKATANRRLIYSETDNGHWVLSIVDDIETARYNVKYIDTIYWVKAADSDKT